MCNLKKYLLAIVVVCCYTNTAMAQWLEAKSEKDDLSISIKMKGGVPSSRVIVTSSLRLGYSSNMGDVTNESVGYGVANGLNSDTVYFYLVDDYKRTLTITAEGYPPISIPYVLGPKETYRCFVFDPNKETEEESPNVNTAHWQFVMAQNFDYGREGFAIDQNEALNWYTKAAEQGHGLAQVTLGVKYASGGDGFAKDEVKAARWFLIAAQQNYDTAQYGIANFFLQGSGVKQDLDKAYYWFQQSADKGIDEARYKMANMLLDGYGTQADVDNLLDWFSFFADENKSDAQYMYSKLLLGRNPSAENEIIAIEYLNKSIALSNSDAMIFLAERCFNKELDQYNIIKGMELLQMAKNLKVAKAEELIAKYEKELSREEVFTYTKHFALNDDAKALATLGNMYYYGDGTDQNFSEAFFCFKSASNKEVIDGYIGLGLCYYYGYGVDVDYIKAFENLSKGSSSNKSEALSGLAQCYYNGYGVAKDREKAFELYTKANNGKNGVAINGLGLCYYDGDCVTQNKEKALALFEEALKLDEYNAGLSLGDYYYNIDSTTYNDKAIEYYTIAARAENPEAQNRLGLLILEKGVTKKVLDISKGVTDTIYVLTNDGALVNALEWFNESAIRNNPKGEYNFAYGLISVLHDDDLIDSPRGRQSVEAFRKMANKGNKEAMIFLSTCYKYNIGIDLTESYSWCQKAVKGSTGDKDRDALYKGLLGCLEYDEAEEIAKITNSTFEQVQSQSVARMIEAASEGCTFLYSRLYNYERYVKEDKKAAKLWDKENDLLTEQQKRIPRIADFKR